MKKRLGFVLAVMALMVMVCLPGTAGAEDYVDVDFVAFCGAGETIQPEYPDLSSMIGEGLTKDDFIITYECRSGGSIKVDSATGQLSVQDSVRYRFGYDLFITYTPKVEGMGERTVFRGRAYEGLALKYLKPDRTEIVLGLDQTGGTMVDFNGSQIARLPQCKVLDPEIVSARMEAGGEWSSYSTLHITPKAVGETIVTVYGYNGISVDVHVKVMEPPTELTFAQEVYQCFEGEELSLGVKLGEGEHAPNFSLAQVNGNAAGMYFKGGITGVFCSDEWGEFRIRAETYNGFSGSAIIRVYEKDVVSDIKLSADIVRAGEENIKVETYDAAGKYVRARYISITKGMDIASMDDNKLITTAPGEIEVTVTNLDGTTVSKTFTIEPYPNEIIFNAEELTLEIGETFVIEVGFDQGWLDYQWWGSEYPEPVPYNLYPTKFDNGVVTAQAPGKSTYRCTAGKLSKSITITVPDSDKALSVHAPENPVGVGDTFRITVKDKTGKVYPAEYAMGLYEDEGEITPDGVFTALEASMATTVRIALEDGRSLSYKIVIVQKPLWLRHAGIVATLGNSASLRATSDVGDIPWRELEVKVADESVATYNENGGTFTPKKKGSTKVTITSIYTGVSTDFTLEVRPQNDNVFVGATSFDLPYGFSMRLPAVYDERGNEKNVKWVITHDNPGKDNPEKSGFKLDGNEIACIWPDASCEVTGYMDGASKWVRVSVFGYKMPDVIYIEPEVIVMDVGDTVAVEVLHDEPGTKFPAVYWIADTEGIIAYTEVRQTANNQFTACKPGTTLVMAYLDNGAYALCMVTVIDPNHDPSVRLPGDANVDGLVNILDALLVLQHDVGWEVEINLSNSDVDGDGAVTILDALKILQYDVGWEVELL